MATRRYDNDITSSSTFCIAWLGCHQLQISFSFLSFTNNCWLPLYVFFFSPPLLSLSLILAVARPRKRFANIQTAIGCGPCWVMAQPRGFDKKFRLALASVLGERYEDRGLAHSTWKISQILAIVFLYPRFCFSRAD